jgi:outer membrane protein OmpA-like peptidoglycan-associated protein
MNAFQKSGLVNRMLVLGGVLLLVPACSTVSPDDLQTELDRLRAEMRAGDEEVEARLGQRIGQVEERLNSRISTLESELGALRSEFGATVERMESAVRFNAPVHFGFDEYELKPEARPLLDRFAQVMQNYYADAIVTVEGFTDTAGSQEYNRRLGMQRAEAVKAYLAERGIPQDRMRAVSYGEASNRQVVPGARGPGEDGWQNRRVALVVDFNPNR